MGTVMRPAGPLPPRVYWVRRLVLLLVIVLLTGVVWWRVGGSGSAHETLGGPGAAPTATTGTAGTNGSTAPKSPGATGKPSVHEPRRGPGRGNPTEPTSTPSKPKKSKKPKPAAPSGDCDPTGIDIQIDVSDSAPGAANAATFLLTSTQTPACTLAITPDTMVVRVTSGPDVVWSSDDCPDALRAQEVVVRADPPSAYEFRWNGHRSSDNCQPVNTLPKSGGYWLEAAVVGGEPHKAYFDILGKKG